MGTYSPNYKSTYNLLRGLRGLISAVKIGVINPKSTYNLLRGLRGSTAIIGVISILNLQVPITD